MHNIRYSYLRLAITAKEPNKKIEGIKFLPNYARKTCGPLDLGVRSWPVLHQLVSPNPLSDSTKQPNL